VVFLLFSLKHINAYKEKGISLAMVTNDCPNLSDEWIPSDGMTTDSGYMCNKTNSPCRINDYETCDIYLAGQDSDDGLEGVANGN